LILRSPILRQAPTCLKLMILQSFISVPAIRLQPCASTCGCVLDVINRPRTRAPTPAQRHYYEALKEARDIVAGQLNALGGAESIAYDFCLINIAARCAHVGRWELLLEHVEGCVAMREIFDLAQKSGPYAASSSSQQQHARGVLPVTRAILRSMTEDVLAAIDDITHCVCRAADDGNVMFQCTSSTCPIVSSNGECGWWHAQCVVSNSGRVPASDDDDDAWLCPRCQPPSVSKAGRSQTKKKGWMRPIDHQKQGFFSKSHHKIFIPGRHRRPHSN